MKILFLSPRQCWPARSGAKLREYHFARALGERGELTYLYFSEPGSAALAQDDLPFCRDIAAVPKPGAYTAMQKLRGLVGEWPLPVLNYTTPAMDAAVMDAVRRKRFDLIHADSIHMIRYARAAHRASGARVVYNWHNVESEAMHRFAETTDSFSKSWYAVQTAAKLEALEREILPEALGHIVCSLRERDKLLSWSPDARIHVAENGVDATLFEGAATGVVEPSLVFVGSMDYFPNIDAVVHFAGTLWPRIQEHLPQLKLTIVGARPAPEVQALGALNGVTVTGTVPDVRPFYANALASVVPLRTGGGTRLKILEAMAAGTPVISTELGAEGLAIDPGRNILIADALDAGSWIRAIEKLIERPALRTSLVNEARALVVSRYDWTTIGADLAATYRTWLES